MKVSQKLLAVLLSLAMLFSLAGCGLDSIVSDSPTSISDRSTDSESSIIDDRSETAGLTETVDECSESNKQEKPQVRAANHQVSAQDRLLLLSPHLSAPMRELHMWLSITISRTFQRPN